MMFESMSSSLESAAHIMNFLKRLKLSIEETCRKISLLILQFACAFFVGPKTSSKTKSKLRQNKCNQSMIHKNAIIAPNENQIRARLRGTVLTFPRKYYALLFTLLCILNNAHLSCKIGT